MNYEHPEVNTFRCTCGTISIRDHRSEDQCAAAKEDELRREKSAMRALVFGVVLFAVAAVWRLVC